MTSDVFTPTGVVLNNIAAERFRQDEKFGRDRDHPDGTGGQFYVDLARLSKRNTDAADAAGCLSWKDILTEEVAEVYAETELAKLRTELVQVAAVATAWVEAIDRRERS